MGALQHSLMWISQHRVVTPPEESLRDWKAEEPHSGQGFSKQSLSTHTYFLSSPAYLGTPGWLGYQGDGQGMGEGRRTAKSPRSPRERGKTSWGQIRSLRVEWGRGGLWLVGTEKASCKRNEALSVSALSHSTAEWL